MPFSPEANKNQPANKAESSERMKSLEEQLKELEGGEQMTHAELAARMEEDERQAAAEAERIRGMIAGKLNINEDPGARAKFAEAQTNLRAHLTRAELPTLGEHEEGGATPESLRRKGVRTAGGAATEFAGANTSESFSNRAEGFSTGMTLAEMEAAEKKKPSRPRAAE